MSKIFILIVSLLCVTVATANAELSEKEMQSVGRFLAMDFKSVSDKQERKPITDKFFVKQVNKEFSIQKEDIFKLHGLSANSIAPGKYKPIVIINEVSGLGGLVRDAYLNEKNQVFWSRGDQSLLKFKHRPELGNTGVLQIMDYENTNSLADLIRNSRRGTIPLHWEPSKSELDFYVSSLNALFTILINKD